MDADNSATVAIRDACASFSRASRNASSARVRSMNCATWLPTVVIICMSSGSTSRTSRPKNSMTPTTPLLSMTGKAKAARSPSFATDSVRCNSRSRVMSGIHTGAPLDHTRLATPIPKPDVPDTDPEPPSAKLANGQVCMCTSTPAS